VTKEGVRHVRQRPAVKIATRTNLLETRAAGATVLAVLWVRQVVSKMGTREMDWRRLACAAGIPERKEYEECPPERFANPVWARSDTCIEGQCLQLFLGGQ
jgi:hypothetical protein